jgi:thiol-disulfide isomerase/thioredoxin
MMKYFFLLIFSISITQPIFGQYKLTIIEEGSKAQLLSEPWVYGVNTYASEPRRINDSTIEYSIENITEPTWLCIIIDTVKREDTNLMWNWNARLWLTPEIKHRELIINYANKTTKIKDFAKWSQATKMDGKSKIVVNNLPKWDSIAQTLDELYRAGNDSAQLSLITSYIEQYHDNYLSLWLYAHTQVVHIESTAQKQALFNKLNPALGVYPLYHQMQADFSGARKYPNPGDTFKEFTLKDVKGKNFNSANIKNKWVLLHFWSNGCGPCVKEMDAMVSYYKTLDTSKIAFISLALDNNRDNWKKAATTQKIIWTNLWEKDNFYGDLCLNYNVYSMPFFVLFDNEKKLVAIQDGADAIETTIKGYLSKVK